MNRCKRCLETKRGVKQHRVTVTVEDDESEDDGVIVGGVFVDLCTTCANELAGLLVDFVRDNTQRGDIQGRKISSY